MPTHPDRATVAETAPATQAVLLTVLRGGRLEYLLATDPTAIPDDLPAGTESASLTVFELAAFDQDAQLVIDAWTNSGWFTLDQVLAHISCARGARRGQRRREERGQ